MDDDTHASGGDEPMPVWCNPIRAKSMEGITAEIIRNLLDHRCDEDLMELYGIRPNEAASSLHFADLASLPAWDAEVLAEVAGVASEEELGELRQSLADATRDVEKQMWANQLASREGADRRLTRRLRLAMLSEQLPEIMSPAYGVLFLRRVGIEVHYELLDAVATFTLRACTDEAVELYRELMRCSGPATQESPPGPAIPAPAESAPVIHQFPPARGMSNAAADDIAQWTVKKPERAQGYNMQLYEYLKIVHAAGRGIPRARDVLAAWKERKPDDVTGVADDSFTYRNSLGQPEIVLLKALGQAIGRMAVLVGPTSQVSGPTGPTTD